MEVRGLTVTLVPVTLPMPWSMLRLVAPLTDQERMVLCPGIILAGLAVKLAIVGRLPDTVTVVVAVVLPPALLAVNR